MAAPENQPHSQSPDEGLHGDAEVTDEADEGSYTDADHDEGDADGDDEHEGHYVESDSGSGHRDTHPERGDYVEKNHGKDRPPPD